MAERSNPILAKKLIIISKSGRKHEYTHVTLINAEGSSLQIAGEADQNGMRANVGDTHKIEGLHLAVIEFYKPPE